MPKVVNEREQRSRILAAARRVFSRAGLASTGLRQVAEEAGMSRPGLYRYYQDKQALVADLARDLLEEERRLFEQSLNEPGTPSERIRRLARGIGDLFADSHDESGVLLQLWLTEPRMVRAMFADLREALAAVIREGQIDRELDLSVDARHMAALVIGLMDGVLVQHVLDPDAFGTDGFRHILVRGVEQLLGAGEA